MPPQLAPGSKAPAFSLPRDGGGTVSLADFKGQNLVVYFYPRADTPGCTVESKAFSALAKAFVKAKSALALPLASDETHRMLDAYGVWGEKSMYGKTFMGITRATYLIDKGGLIAPIWPKGKVEGHADEVLAAAKAL